MKPSIEGLLLKPRKPKRVIRVSKRLMGFLMPRRALAFCIPKTSAVGASAVAILATMLIVVLYHFLAFPNFVLLIFSILLGFPLAFMIALYFSSAVVIRKDCYGCILGFHIIAHERNHLALNSRDEVMVEEETLKQTQDRLIPILLSDPKICKDCFFAWRRMYCRATHDCLSEGQKEE